LPPTTKATAHGAESSPDDLLIGGGLSFGLCLSPADVSAFRIYREEILRWSERMNLTALTTPAQIVQQGFLDSLVCGSLFPPGAQRILDVGSGAGFPAIPIAVIRPDLQFTLVEPTRKKVTFLKHIVRQLQLTHVYIRPGRLEEFLCDKAMRDTFDVALARAVAPLPESARKVHPFLRPQGVFLAQVGSSTRRLICSGFESVGETEVPPAFGKPGRRIVSLRKIVTP
jgi:16S rRNA (guanine527-N7)-methyltransferase